MNYEKYGLVNHDASLKEYNTYQIDTKVKYLIMPDTKQNLIELINNLNETNTPYYILGNGSNIILPDEYFDGVVIVFKKINNIVINEKEGYAILDAGCMLPIVNQELLKKGYTNFIYLCGIPGTIGASIMGNAGAYKHDMSENLISIEALVNNQIKEILKEDIEFSYRKTNLENIIVLSAKYKLVKDDLSTAKEIIKTNQEKRISSQPLEYPNAGSVFKNPPNESAGRLIDECNLKGVSIGGASISKKHANFIINENNATSNDIKKLIELVQKEIRNKYGIDLILEQKIVKWN